jgi:hypothetical protein
MRWEGAEEVGFVILFLLSSTAGDRPASRASSAFSGHMPQAAAKVKAQGPIMSGADRRRFARKARSPPGFARLLTG